MMYADLFTELTAIAEYSQRTDVVAKISAFREEIEANITENVISFVSELGCDDILKDILPAFDHHDDESADSLLITPLCKNKAKRRERRVSSKQKNKRNNNTFNYYYREPREGEDKYEKLYYSPSTCKKNKLVSKRKGNTEMWRYCRDSLQRKEEALQMRIAEREMAEATCDDSYDVDDFFIAKYGTDLKVG